METFHALKVWSNCQRVDQPLALCRGLSATSSKGGGRELFLLDPLPKWASEDDYHTNHVNAHTNS